jgi:hypothetical protein
VSRDLRQRRTAERCSFVLSMRTPTSRGRVWCVSAGLTASLELAGCRSAAAVSTRSQPGTSEWYCRRNVIVGRCAVPELVREPRPYAAGSRPDRQTRASPACPRFVSPERASDHVYTSRYRSTSATWSYLCRPRRPSGCGTSAEASPSFWLSHAARIMLLPGSSAHERKSNCSSHIRLRTHSSWIGQTDGSSPTQSGVQA